MVTLAGIKCETRPARIGIPGTPWRALAAFRTRLVDLAGGRSAQCSFPLYSGIPSQRTETTVAPASEPGFTTLSRRQFNLLAIGSAAGLFIGFRASGEQPVDAHVLHRLVHVGNDDSITIYVPNPEIGQGVKTALSMIVAEELEVTWENIRVEQAKWDSTLERQFSGGSLSVRLNYQAMREAGALARARLLAAAAHRWGVSAADLRAANGRVSRPGSDQYLHYGTLAREAASIEVAKPELKSESAFTVVGKSHPDSDIGAIVTGTQRYSLDISFPEMRYAKVARCPHPDGRAVSFDASAARQVSGVLDVFALDNRDHGGRIILPNCPNFVSGVVVVAEHAWAALEGARKLEVEWELPEARDQSDELRKAFAEGVKGAEGEFEVVRLDGNLESAQAEASTRLDVVYELPFLAHVPMEPMNCTVAVREDGVEAWIPTQNPGMAAEVLAKALGVAPEKIEIHVVRSGGAFGRRYYADFVVDAALVSAKLLRPVKLLWSREDDVRHDYFRPASAQRVRAGLDKRGRVCFWHHTVASHPRQTYLEREGSPAEIANYEFPAAFVPALRYDYRAIPARVPVGQWRAVEHSSNVFVVSSVLDELAHASGRDPVELWLDLVGSDQFVQVREDFRFDASRLRAVIETVAQMADWRSPVAQNVGKGIAASYNQGAWVAEVVEVVVKDNHLKVSRVWAAVDCGRVINPSGALQQVQGAVTEGLSAALFGDITVVDGVVQQQNFDSYRLCRMHQVPTIEVRFTGPGGAPRGLGEPPLPPLAPALCNAIFAACGKRIRKLPLKDHFTVT